ncbi:DUF2934 domain-containing protein [Methylococcus sp. ANG]|jgi:hypothetical protein|uniref:DUF2934 domain-containing protein n=1 Tax=unclassified Methylococcus TaxID=2618889 RepID=UPI001C52AD6E|nr:DUF2934 domain-containing protein [Methylococcus sp. Mc7]QXP85636.1 DUF2934 domain-containing protein [Methylococcus sp. Mc7]
MAATVLSRTTKPVRYEEAETVPPPPDPDMLRALIAEAAYLRAEKRGFVGGSELEDWLEAEKEVLEMQERLSIPTPD